ncbi:MAG: hypothetical protein Q9164_003666 [Protoblastenia rupestris]
MSAVPVNLSLLHNVDGPLNGTPRQFGIRATYTLQQITVTDTLVNALSAIVDLGLADFESPMQTTSFTVPSYSSVRITFKPPTRGVQKAKKKYAIWGLSTAISAMVRDKKFVKSQWFLSWNNEPVGSITFASQDARNALAFGEQAMPPKTTTTDPSKVGLKTSNSANPSNAQELQVSVSFTEGSLPIFDVFLAAIHLIADVAEYEDIDIVEPQSHTDPQNNVAIRFANDYTPPRTTDPRFQYRYMMQALRMIPIYMLEKGKSGDAEVVLEVDGIVVGDGYIKKGETGVRRMSADAVGSS